MDDIVAQRDCDIALVAPSNSVDIDIPVCDIDPQQENFGIDSTSVEEARIYLARLKLANAPPNEQKQGEIYLTKLERQVDENENGSTLYLQTLRNSTIHFGSKLDRVVNYLHIDEDNQNPTSSIDFGNNALNQLYALIRSDIRRLEDRMDRRLDRMDRRLDRMDGRLDRTDRLTDSQRGMVKNGLLAAGGSEDSGNSYKPICNDNGEYPGETSYIQEIISLDQINSMTSSTLDLYLNFYNLGRNRLIAEKKGKLIRFLGINERVMITQKTTHGATPC